MRAVYARLGERFSAARFARSLVRIADDSPGITELLLHFLETKRQTDRDFIRGIRTVAAL